MKKIAALLLSLAVLFSVCGCREASENSSMNTSGESLKPSKENTMSLLYSFGDSFNPYIATTEQNRNIAQLLYDPLVKVDDKFEPEYYLVQDVALEGTVCRVTLKNVYFTDGSAVTADDVVYSYNAAKNSATAYAAQLSVVLSAAAESASTVVFTLAFHDAHFVNLLDFPIFKTGSDSLTDADGVEIPPVGCGRYYVAEDLKRLQLNENYYGQKGSVKEIELINAPDADSISHYVEIGAADVYYTDVSDGNIVRMSGKKVAVNLNHLVYIGINSSYGMLETKEMRYAISWALDRAAICQGAYYNNATAATGFFNPVFEQTKPMQTLDNKANLQITVENLSKIGYNSLDNGFYSNSSGNHPSFTLLVNSENHSRVLAARLIASQCKAAGIEINVIERSYNEYVSLLASNNFQLYLGEIKVNSNMDLSALTVPGGSAAYGVGLEPKEVELDENGQPKPMPATVCETMVASYRAGESDLADLAGAFLTEMPQIPICYRNGVLIYSDDISGGVNASVSDIYYSVQKYTFN